MTLVFNFTSFNQCILRKVEMSNNYESGNCLSLSLRLCVGSYLLLISSRGQNGDRAALRTPFKNFVQSMKLTFHYHMLLSDMYDRTTSLAIFKLSTLLVYEELLFFAEGEQNLSKI